MSMKVIRRPRGAGAKGLKSLAGGPDKVKVGFPAGKADSDVISRAVWNEFGTRGGASGGGWGGPIPERPFMRNTMRDSKGNLEAAMTAGAKSILHSVAQGGDPAATKRQVLGKLGILAQGLIQQEITALTTPPNSPVTIALKGSSKPLIDTGEMRQAVSFKIEE